MASGPPNISDINRLDAALGKSSKQGLALISGRTSMQSQQTSSVAATIVNQGVTYQSQHIAYRGGTDIRFCYTNTAKAEQSLYNNITVRSGITIPSSGIYPIGSSAVFPFTFSGSKSAVIAPGGKNITDSAGFELPAGTVYYIRTYVETPAIGDQFGLGQICYSGLFEGVSPVGVDLTRANVTITAITKANPAVFTTSVPHGLVVGQKIFITGVTGTTTTNWNKNDGTSGAPNANGGSPTVAKTVNTVPSTTTFTIDTAGTILDTSAFAGTFNGTNSYVGGPSDYSNNIYVYGPCLAMGIVSPYENVTVACMGDSIAFGLNSNGNYNNGFMQMALSTANIPWTNLGVSGDTVKAYVANGGHVLRGDYAGYCTHALIEYGVNDIHAGDDAATVWTNLTTMAASLIRRGVTPFICTVTPRTTSTDSWATAANQTLYSSSENTVRLTLNNTIRTQWASAGFAGMFDICSVVECNSSGTLTPGGGFWLPNYTADGVHMITAGHTAAAAVIDTTKFKF